MNTISIRVDPKDAELMRKDCKKRFLKDNPKFKGLELSRKFMFHKVVEYYLNV